MRAVSMYALSFQWKQHETEDLLMFFGIGAFSEITEQKHQQTKINWLIELIKFGWLQIPVEQITKRENVENQLHFIDKIHSREHNVTAN